MAKGINTDNFSKVEVSSSDALRRWLQRNHKQTDSVWLVTFKASAGAKYLSREDVLDELLCFGWIDGVRRRLDSTRTMQLISPRKTQHWAKSYKDRASKLIAEGRMAEPGLQSIKAAKQSGLWTFMDDVDALIRPPDLVRAFKDWPASAENFDAFPASAQRFTLRWIKLAKTDATRNKRIKTTAELATRGEFVPGVRMK